MNAAKSDILALQTIGRGLRLPFGEITKIEELDTLDIVAHDHYREIVDDIKNNPVFKKRNLDEEDIPSVETVKVEATVENAQLSLFDEIFCENNIKSFQSLKDEKTVDNLFEAYQKAFIKRAVSKKATEDSEQMTLFDYMNEKQDEKSVEHEVDALSVQQDMRTEKIDIKQSAELVNIVPYAKQTFQKKMEELKRVAIAVPKINISYSSTITFHPFKVKRNIQDFDVAASRIERYDTINEKLLQVLDADVLIAENPENMLAVSLLESIPEFSSDDAEFILDVVNQYLALIEESAEDKKRVVRRYATLIVNDLKKQIYASKDEKTEFVYNVQKDLIVFGQFVKNMKVGGKVNYRKEIADKKNIKQYLFTGYKKSYYADNAFESDEERKLSVILEDDEDVIRFIKPPLNQLGLFYRAAKQYNPDFLVEVKDKKYMIEVKAENQTDREEVLEKAKAAIKWCQCATEVDADGKSWEYKMIPANQIVIGNTLKYVAGLAVPIDVEE